MVHAQYCLLSSFAPALYACAIVDGRHSSCPCPQVVSGLEVDNAADVSCPSDGAEIGRVWGCRGRGVRNI